MGGRVARGEVHHGGDRGLTGEQELASLHWQWVALQPARPKRSQLDAVWIVWLGGGEQERAQWMHRSW